MPALARPVVVHRSLTTGEFVSYPAGVDPGAADGAYIQAPEAWVGGVVPYPPNPDPDEGGGGGGGGGSSLVTKTAVALGTQSASQSGYTYYEITDVCARGMVSLLEIAPTVLSGSLYDVEVRDGNGTGDIFLQALDVSDSAYVIEVPWYLEGSETSSVWIGVKNKSAGARTFSLPNMRVEKFA